MLKKTTAIILIMILALSISSPAYAALPDESQTTPRSIEEILNDHHAKIFELENQPAASTYSRSTVTEESITQDTLSELQAAGYEAYNVTASNYDTLEAELKTDFASMGLDSSGSYIIVVSGDPATDTNASVSPYTFSEPSIEIGDDNLSSSFYHTYNGHKLLMRFVTVTAADDSLYGRTSTVNLCESQLLSTIENILNTVISGSLEYLPDGHQFGTVASLTGFQFVDFPDSTSTSLRLTGGTNWTRVYTQIYDSDLELWFYWSSVEYVTQYTKIDGERYDSASNRYVDIEGEKSYVTKYTSHYFDYTYRKDLAALAWTERFPRHELTGNAYYFYGNEHVITHQELF